VTRRVVIGPPDRRVVLGGGAPISIQSMTNTDTRDVEATLAQIRALADAGCALVRVSVYDMACAQAIRALVDSAPVPLVADIHFDAGLAVAAMEQGIAKLRLNPGNIGGADQVRRVADCAKAHGVPIRVGVNGGSLEKALLNQYGGPTPKALAESALTQARRLESFGLADIVVSVKASGVGETVAANRLVAAQSDYPLHIGLTEAGLPEDGLLKSAVVLGALLLDGIGDTIRVSLSGDPLIEPAAAKTILRAAGLLRDRPEIIACPTCGRTCQDVAGIAARVKAAVGERPLPLKIAIMGCIVNGPGEAREADIGIACAKEGGALFTKGKPPRPIKGDLAEALLQEIEAMSAFSKEKSATGG
jgi:(E)-4-hydroxy-3-methylbut-2-enyl-diphosphate synthase